MNVWTRAVRRSRDGSTSSGTGLSAAFVVTSGLTVFYLLVGGSSRFDTLSVPGLRLVAVLATFYGLWRLPLCRDIPIKLMLGALIVAFAITLVYLVPLPSPVWHQLAGRGPILEVDHVAGLGAVYRPLSMSPVLTQNAFFALFVPASLLVNGLGLTEAELRSLAPVVMIGGLASCVLGIAQLLGPSDGLLYLYHKTTNGAAVGLFANRNHHAIFLASVLPVIIVYATTAERKRRTAGRKVFAAMLLACLIVPMLLVIGSRGAFVAALFALACLPPLYFISAHGVPSSRSKRRLRIAMIAGAMLLGAIVSWAALSPRAETLVRITTPDADPEMRFKVWPVVFENLRTFGFWGPGPGTYEVAYKLVEPDVDLRPTYSNHAHNDWLETVFTLGVPGAVLLLSAVGVIVVAMTWLVRRRCELPNRAWGWAGIVIIGVFAIGSLVDYPLRVPSLLALLVIACLWLRLGATPRRPAHSSASSTVREDPCSPL